MAATLMGLAVVVAPAALPAAARATPAPSPPSRTVDPAYRVDEVITGFPTQGDGRSGIGPTGIAFDAQGRLWVTDVADASVYRDDSPSAGVADAAGLRLGLASSLSINGRTTPIAVEGIAFLPGGRLVGVRPGQSDLVELSPDDGHMTAKLIDLPDGAGSIAADPTGDRLYAGAGTGGLNQGGLDRVDGVAAGTPKATQIDHIGIDGLVVTPAGDVYGVTYGEGGIPAVGDTKPPGSTTEVLFRVPASPAATVSTDGLRTVEDFHYDRLANLTKPDGVALFEGDTVHPRILVNRNDGTMTVVDTSVSPATTQDIVTKGSRGDMVAVGPDHCLYATESTDVVRISGADGSCHFVGTVAAAATGGGFPWWVVLLLVGVALVLLAVVVVTRRRRAAGRPALAWQGGDHLPPAGAGSPLTTTTLRPSDRGPPPPPGQA